MIPVTIFAFYQCILIFMASFFIVHEHREYFHKNRDWSFVSENDLTLRPMKTYNFKKYHYRHGGHVENNLGRCGGEIKNSKIHALVYINLCFHFGSGCLYPLKNCSKCSYTRYYVVFHRSLDWGLKVCCILILLITCLRRRYSHNRRVEKASFFKPICFYG